jgi:hypothetical protein
MALNSPAQGRPQRGLPWVVDNQCAPTLTGLHDAGFCAHLPVEPLQGSCLGRVQTQRSPLRGQPWAAEFNSFGVRLPRGLTFRD